MKRLFIFFGGLGMANDLWNYDLTTMKKINFVNKLKKHGDIYLYMPNFYNIGYYTNPKEVQKFYNKKLDFTLDDIDIKKCTNEAYREIKKYGKYDKYVIIGTSISFHFAIELSKLIKNSVIVSIEGSSIGLNVAIKFKNELDNYFTV